MPSRATDVASTNGKRRALVHAATSSCPRWVQRAWFGVVDLTGPLLSSDNHHIADQMGLSGFDLALIGLAGGD